jgi:Uncharacterised nucleotidyltransferase
VSRVEPAATPLADIVAEAERLLAAARANDAQIRLLGGLAVYFHTEEIPAPLRRSYGDIDVATTKGAGRSAAELLSTLGYEPAKEFNALHGSRRMLFYDMHNERKLDVFVDTFELCHTIPITGRLALDPHTIPLAELLLTKLQVVELTEKDMLDIVTLLQQHDVGPRDDDVINSDFIAGLTADDWGLWRTIKLNVERIDAQIGSVPLDADARERVIARANALWERIEQEPKSRKWRLRDRVGDRKRWYEMPDEV